MIFQHNSKVTDKNTLFFHETFVFNFFLTAFLKYYLSNIQEHIVTYTCKLLNKQLLF